MAYLCILSIWGFRLSVDIPVICMYACTEQRDTFHLCVSDSNQGAPSAKLQEAQQTGSERTLEE